MLKSTAFIFIAVLSFPALLYSDTIIVPDDYPTIQGAMNAAVNGDTVLVKPGTYGENIDFKGKAITVRSDQGPNNTVIDANQTGSAVVFEMGEGINSVLDGFTLTNGSGTFNPLGNFVGGGIYCWDSSPTIKMNIISGNACAFGGGFYCHNHLTGPFPIVTMNTLSDNSAGNGGGIYCIQSSLEISDNDISGNSSDYGAGIMCWGASPEITENSIWGNTGMTGGGGGIICSTNANPMIANNTITGNVNYWGGGIYCYQSSPEIRENTIADNIADIGAGIACSESSPDIKENTLSDNAANQEGGGVFCTGTSSPTVKNNTITGNSGFIFGGGIEFAYGCSPTIENNIIMDNEARTDGGGGIVLGHDCTGTIANNVIAGNSAKGTNWCGGGILFGDNCSMVISNNLIYNNTSTKGGGIDIYFESDAIICNNTIHGNTATNSGGGMACRVSSSATVINTILWHNSAPSGPGIFIGSPAYPSTVTISYSDLEGGQTSVANNGSIFNWGPGMIDADPQYVDPASNDFHLTYLTSCKDTGDNTAVTDLTDFEGDPRICEGSVDMGADEFYTHLYVTGDKTPGGAIAGKLVGLPGTTPVGLFIGSGVLPSPVNTMWGEYWLQAPWILLGPLGAIPTDGVMVLKTTLPPTPPAPYDVPMQALIGLNADSLSNLCVLEVR